MNPFADIPDDQLTYQYWQKSKEQARLEEQWEIVDNQRLPVLAEITGWFQGSHASAERQARITKEYQEFLTRRGEVKRQLHLARARTRALELEIKLRLNKSFQERAEYKSGHLQP